MEFRDITAVMAETYEKKNHDYGNSFNDTLDEYGLLPSVIRMREKLQRVEVLSKGIQLVEDESLRDSLLDLANYAIMTIMWIDSKVYELCPNCNKEVMLEAIMEYQICPSCSSIIKPCSFCNSEEIECNNCPIGPDITK